VFKLSFPLFLNTNHVTDWSVMSLTLVAADHVTNSAVDFTIGRPIGSIVCARLRDEVECFAISVSDTKAEIICLIYSNRL